MDQIETSGHWDAPDGNAHRPAATGSSRVDAVDVCLHGADVLARFPALDTAAPSGDLDEREDNAKEANARPDNRLIGQPLARKLFVGVCLLLAGAAVVPWVFRKNEGTTPTDTGSQSWRPSPPAPNADEAPAWNGNAVQNAAAQPGASPPAPPPIQAAAPQIDLQPPRVELNQPMALDYRAPAEPGTARFEGTIETPPVMTTDDRGRRDLY